MEIGKIIQQKRKEKKLTQEELAQILGVSSAAISKWETEAAYPDITMLAPLARLLQLSMDELLGFRAVLTSEEVNQLMMTVKELFDLRQGKQAVQQAEALMQEYPDNLYLKFSVAGLYMKYMSAEMDETFMRQQLERSIALFEASSLSDQLEIKEASLHVLSGLYSTINEHEKALQAIEQLPQRSYDPMIMKSNILFSMNEWEKSRELDQASLFQALNHVRLNLFSLAKTAKRKEEIKEAERLIQCSVSLDQLFEMRGIITANAYLFLISLYCDTQREKAEQALINYQQCFEEELALEKTLCFDTVQLSNNQPTKKFMLENALLTLQDDCLNPLKDSAVYFDVVQDFKYKIEQLQD